MNRSTKIKSKLQKRFSALLLSDRDDVTANLSWLLSAGYPCFNFLVQRTQSEIGEESQMSQNDSVVMNQKLMTPSGEVLSFCRNSFSIIPLINALQYDSF